MGYEWQLKGSFGGTTANESYGNSVLLSGDGLTAVVGSPVAEKVYIYKLIGGAWTLNHTLTLSTIAPYSFAMSTNGTILAVGLKNSEYTRGVVLVYRYTNGVWARVNADVINGLSASGDTDFGSSIAMSADGTILAIGSPRVGFVGRVLVVKWSGTDWEEYGTVSGTTGDSFGASVVMSADASKLYVGQPLYSSLGLTNRGAVSEYTWNVTTSTWDKNPMIRIGQSAGDQFGQTIALSGDGTVLAVGSSGYDSGKGRIITYGKTSTITGTVNGEVLGYSIGLSYDGSTMVYGSGYGNYVRVVSWVNGAWAPKGTISSSGLTRDGVVVSLSSDGNTVISGSPASDFGTIVRQGIARIFSYVDVPVVRPKNKVTNRQEVEDAVADPTIESIEVLNDINALTSISSSSGTKIFFTLTPKSTLSA